MGSLKKTIHPIKPYYAMKDIEIIQQILNGNHLNRKEHKRAKQIVRTLNIDLDHQAMTGQELAEYLEMNKEHEAFEYIMQSKINGNHQQTRDLYNKLCEVAQAACRTYLERTYKLPDIVGLYRTILNG